LVGCNKIAIDCDCVAGSDIAYLRKEKFIVHAFVLKYFFGVGWISKGGCESIPILIKNAHFINQ